MTDSIKTIVVLIALPEEYEQFQVIFPAKGDLACERCVCLEHTSGQDDIRLISVLAEQMGAQSASYSAEIAIRNFSPDLLVVLGIAGGVSDDLALCDVAVSNEVFDVLHNNKISEKKGSGTDISFAPSFYNVNAELVSTFAFLRIHPSLAKSYQEWQSLACHEAEQSQISDDVGAPAQLHIGPIACGPVSASPKFNEKLKGLHRKVMAIETESGGVFERVGQAGIPAIAIRGISDLADADKAALERRTKGAARRVAMRNAANLLKIQLANPKFLAVVSRFAARKSFEQPGLFSQYNVPESLISELEAEAKARLKELSSDFKSRPDGFYLPIPRARRVSYAEELASKALEEPENLVDCLANHDRTIIRLPRTFPSQALGWSLAYSLLRQQIDGKVVLPFVITGKSITPPKTGLKSAIPEQYRSVDIGDEYIKVFIIEEPQFESRSRLRFLSEELTSAKNAKVMILTKAEDHVATVDAFVRENALTEFELAPVSFSETAFFLERTFDMTPTEAEAVAIRLDDTFRKFRLDAHPTYFAGLQEDTLAALINANKRAELIQLAVDGLLTLIVAADNAKRGAHPSLSRTTRERFLRRLVLEVSCSDDGLSDEHLSAMAQEFLKEYAFDVNQTEFLSPFFEMGILYLANGKIQFTHPYLESYLLAEALRENPEAAKAYFNPHRLMFNFYAYDLYCELGPDAGVVDAIQSFAENVLTESSRNYPDPHVYIEKGKSLTALSNAGQLAGLTQGLVKTAQKLDREETSENVRTEKQRIIDAKTYVKTEVVSRTPGQAPEVPTYMQTEFEILDGLSRSLALSSTSIGSGSEALDAEAKQELAKLVLKLAAKFSDVWTRNRLRVNFDEVRSELLSDEKIWKYVEETGIDPKEFSTIKSELELFLHGAELNAIVEPMGRILWRISSTAGVQVLAPILENLDADDPIERVIRGSWYMDVDPRRGKEILKAALADYKGSPLFRIVLASHLLWRVFWHHYKTAGATHFLTTAQRALAPIGLVPAPKRLEQVKQGPNAKNG